MNPEQQTQISASAASILDNIAALASDPFAGRAPGSQGEEVTVEFLHSRCLAMGLEVACQPVPVLAVRSTPELKIESGRSLGRKLNQKEASYSGEMHRNILNCRFPEDYVAMSRHNRSSIAFQAAAEDLLFVGFGIQAPEYDWDDYKGTDVTGKILVMRAGDPSRTSADGNLDEDFFDGAAMTYYGRWTYKFEIASKLGARAVFIIHDTAAAGYNYDVVKASWAAENFNLDQAEQRVEVEGWLAKETAQSLFAIADLNFADCMDLAQRSDFKPLAIPALMEISVKNETRRFTSTNVIAKLKAQNPTSDECLIYCAHWDHFGSKFIDCEGERRQDIFSGALDNASGVAVLLEVAAILKERPRQRDILFLFTTLEEYGLLGARYYTENPLVPLAQTIAVINLDIMNPWGRTRKFVSITRGHSTLDEVLEAEALKQNRQVISDPEPEKGYFFRSDHLEFMRRGVPALFFLNPGLDYLDHDEAFAEAKRREYLHCDYHKVSDKVKPDWDLCGMAEDCQLVAEVGHRLCLEERPVWLERSSFAKSVI